MFHCLFSKLSVTTSDPSGNHVGTAVPGPSWAYVAREGRAPARPELSGDSPRPTQRGQSSFDLWEPTETQGRPCGATDWDRTSNLRLRRPTLYPIELQSQQKSQPESWRREGDSNPRYGFTPYDDLANRCLQPLSHPSYALETNTEGRPLHAPSCASVV